MFKWCLFYVFWSYKIILIKRSGNEEKWSKIEENKSCCTFMLCERGALGGNTKVKLGKPLQTWLMDHEYGSQHSLNIVNAIIWPQIHILKVLGARGRSKNSRLQPYSMKTIFPYFLNIGARVLDPISLEWKWGSFVKTIS